jgi:hypothetical protein
LPAASSIKFNTAIVPEYLSCSDLKITMMTVHCNYCILVLIYF